jgi:hypothetical protein
LFAISSAFCQQSKDYVIKLNRDTIFTKVLRIDKKMRSIACEEKGKKIRYKAKDVLEIKSDTAFYETGLVQLKRLSSKQYVFLRRVINGKLSLYKTNIERIRLLMRNFGEDLIHGRMIYAGLV